VVVNAADRSLFMRCIWRQNAQASTQAALRRGIDDARAYERDQRPGRRQARIIRIWMRAIDAVS
jgi:hypothetical protein